MLRIWRAGWLGVLLVLACRPDPYALAVRAIRPGAEVELPGGMTLVAGDRDGAVLSDVTVTGPAQTCDGTMTLTAPEVRLERGEKDRVRLVLEEPVAEERCGNATATTKHHRLTLYLDAP